MNSRVSSLTKDQYKQYKNDDNYRRMVDEKISEGWLFILIPNDWTFTFTRGSGSCLGKALGYSDCITLHMKNTKSGKSADLTSGKTSGIVKFTVSDKTILEEILEP